jgi:Na+/glutamate symporter
VNNVAVANPTFPDIYEIIYDAPLARWIVRKNNILLTDRGGNARYFKTRNSARKRISRERAKKLSN